MASSFSPRDPRQSPPVAWPPQECAHKPAWLIAPGSRQVRSYPRAADTPSSAHQKSPNPVSASALLWLRVLVLSTSSLSSSISGCDPHTNFPIPSVEVILQTLQTLGDTETLFFIDELGPLAVKKYGGRSFVKKGKALVVPQLQTPKGSIVLVG